MSPARNLALALAATLVMTLGVMAVNWHVDPFALRNPGAAAVPAEGAVKLKQAYWHKTFAVAALKPAGLIMGTSRADWALDGAHPGFADGARPAYNFALPGASVEQMREMLVHAQRTRPLRQVVIGLDLEAFLVGRTDFDPALLAGSKASMPGWMNLARLNLSWSALEASAAPLWQTTPESAAPLEPVGKRTLFRGSEFNNFHARRALLFPRWDPATRWESDSRRAASMRALRELVSFARAEGIDLRLFISPVHARYLEAYRRVGWWPLFEAWKRALVATLAEEARAHPGRAAFPLWDFSGFNSVTMERVPALDDAQTPMRWYVDSSHYSRAHGNLILDRVLDRPDAGGQDAASAGTLLYEANLDAHLLKLRQDADAFRAAFPADVAEVGRLMDAVRRSTRF